jgi:diadenosine tetraphosphatase ApaH/serine/threonine PP2A family protein phosphatase
VRLAVISDIHSNLEALQAVLAQIEQMGCDHIVCLGDVVGYGADPGPCVDLVRERCAAVVRGNHDQAVADGAGLEYLPRDGQEAAVHNRKLLSEEQLAYLNTLPLVDVFQGFTLAHATPEAPDTWRRLDSFTIARAQFSHFDTAVCFIGHTHIPAVMAEKLGVLRVRRGSRFLVNVGSVGQPRDTNPQACFVVFDTDLFTCRFVRVPYDLETTARKIADAGLPKALGQRLRVGR